MFARGRQAYLDGELDLARGQLEQAYALAPSAELAYNLARVLERMGRAEDSARYYRIYLRQGRVTAKERAGIEQRLSKLEALARQQSAQALKAPPTRGELAAEARAFFERGAKLYARGKYGEALIAFGAAQRFAALPELSYNMALTEERLGHARAAVDHYRAYLRMARQPKDEAEVRQRIATLLSR